MIFNRYQKNQTRNIKKIEPIKNYASLANKTRIESLNDRIHKANELINSLVEKAITEKIEEKQESILKPINNQPQKTLLKEAIKSDENNKPNTINTNKSVQVDENINLEDNNDNTKNIQNNEEEKIIENNNENKDIENNNENKDIENKNENHHIETNIENNNFENNSIANNNIENRENQNKNENTNIEKKEEKEQIQSIEEKRNEPDIDIPFLKRTKLLLLELKKLKEKSLIKEEAINNEIVTELPKRSILEISLSDIKSKKKCEILNKKLIEKDKMIKELESELFNQRQENIKLKRSENEYILKISALEDELRVFKSKFINIYSKTEKNTAQEYGEKLVRSMWIRDNILDNNNNDINNDTNSNMTFKKSNINELKNNNRFSFYKDKWGAPFITQSQRKINNNNYNYNEPTDSNNNLNNFNNKNGGQSNFQRISGMILNNNKSNNRIRLNKKYGNDFNRFGNGNNYNQNNF